MPGLLTPDDSTRVHWRPIRILFPERSREAELSVVRWIAMCNENRFYRASPRNREPITAQDPGVKCLPWSASIAQEILDPAEPVGNTLQATCKGVGFVARETQTTSEGAVWHGYPEAWDKMGLELKKGWQKEGRIHNRDLRAYASRRKVRDAFGGRYVGG